MHLPDWETASAWFAFTHSFLFWGWVIGLTLIAVYTMALLRKRQQRRAHYGTSDRFEADEEEETAGTSPPPPPGPSPRPQPAATTVTRTSFQWPSLGNFFLVLGLLILAGIILFYLSKMHFVDPSTHTTRVVTTETPTTVVHTEPATEQEGGCTRASMLLTLTQDEVRHISKPAHCEVSIDPAVADKVKFVCDPPKGDLKYANCSFTLKPDPESEPQDVLLTFITK